MLQALIANVARSHCGSVRSAPIHTAVLQLLHRFSGSSALPSAIKLFQRNTHGTGDKAAHMGPKEAEAAPTRLTERLTALLAQIQDVKSSAASFSTPAVASRA